MKRIEIPSALRGKDLFNFLIANKDALIAQKKSVIKFTDAVTFSPSFFNCKGSTVSKAEPSQIEPDATTLRVKVVANTSLWCDSHMDVLLRDSGKKSMKDRKGMIPHLHDHVYNVVDAEVGDVIDIYYEELSLRELGLNKMGTAQALVFETDIQKSYNEKVFNKYKSGRIKQHSIGLQYLKLELAINDDESEKEFDFWNKYVEQVINRELVEEKGYFWVVPEYRLIENSAVLFGSNQLTPTLDTKANTDDEPLPGTQNQPLQTGKSNGPKAINWDKMANAIF